MKSNDEFIKFFNGLSIDKKKRSNKLQLCPKKLKVKVLKFGNYFLAKRIITENNFHHIYTLFTIGLSFNLSGFLETLLKTSFEIYKIFYIKRKGHITRNEKNILKSIGSWLGKLFY